MPLYEFRCEGCKKEYETLASWDEAGKFPGVSCPKCGSEEKTQFIGALSFKFSNPIGTDRWHSDSMGHDYRHNWNMDRPGGVRDQREFAEQNSHVGPSPYVDNTQQDIQLDGRMADLD